MKKLIFLLTILIHALVFKTNAQSVTASAKGGFAYASGSLDSEIGAMATLSVENKFNKILSIGINGKFGGASYSDEESLLNNNIIIQENELEINNTVFAVNFFSKLSFITTDDITLSFIPELGFYWFQSDPTIYFIDKQTADVTHKDYGISKSGREISYGLHLEGQYYLTDKLNVLVSIGGNNYDIETSLNKVDLDGDWSSSLNEQSFFLYFEVGVSYSICGKSYFE